MIREIQKALFNHPEFIEAQYRIGDNPLFGHCYVASEVYYHLYGKENGFVPYCLSIELGTHWFLKNKNTDEIIDITCAGTRYDYSKARRIPFRTKNPSKRAMIIIKEM